MDFSILQGYLKVFWKYLTFSLFEISGNSVSILSIITAVLLILVFQKLSVAAEKMMGNFLKDKQVDSGVKSSIGRISRYVVLVIGVLITLDTIGINLNSLAVVGSVFMVGIGFGLQNITQNFMSGLIILFERPIKVGDMVKVGGVSGRVVDIQARSTLIHTREDIAIIVPNSQFISEQVVNESFSGDKIRMSIKVGVAYGSDVRLVEKTLLNICKDHPDVMNTPEADVLFKDFGDSSLDFELRIWIQDNWRYEKILSDLRFKIDESFRANNITIPFPQRDVHVFNSKQIS